MHSPNVAAYPTERERWEALVHREPDRYRRALPSRRAQRRKPGGLPMGAEAQASSAESPPRYPNRNPSVTQQRVLAWYNGVSHARDRGRLSSPLQCRGSGDASWPGSEVRTRH